MQVSRYQNILHSYLLLITVCLASSCRHKPAVNAEMDMSLAEEAKAHFDARKAVILPLSGQIHIRQDGVAGLIMQADVDTVLGEDDHYYFAVQSPFSQPLKVLTIAKTKVQLLDLVDGLRFYEGTLNDNTLSYLLPIPLTLVELKAILLADIPNDWQAQTLKPHPEGALLQYRPEHSPHLIYELVFAPNGRIQKWRFISGHTVRLEVELSWDEDLTQTLPNKWHVMSEMYDISFSMRNKGLEQPEISLNPMIFHQTPPPNTPVSAF